MMTRLYVAAHLPEAHLVRGLLQAAGIGARVFNEYAPGGLGDLPAAAAYPEVWIEEERDFARARGIVEHYERKPPPAGTRPCGHCGEENPVGFELCWQCQKPL